MAGATDEPGRGRALADPAFPADDGVADPRVRAMVAAAARGDVPVLAAARALREERLLATVVAVLDEADAEGGEKDSHMAVVSMVNERGEKGLLAFTGVDALAAWDEQARPVPALGRDTARAAVDDGAHAIILDVAGPERLIIQGTALAALLDDLDLPGVTALVQAALAPLTSDGWVEVAVVDARATELGADVLVQVTVPAGGEAKVELVFGGAP